MNICKNYRTQLDNNLGQGLQKYPKMCLMHFHTASVSLQTVFFFVEQTRSVGSFYGNYQSKVLEGADDPPSRLDECKSFGLPGSF